MTDEREQKYLGMIEQFPDSPLGHFSLGKYYVEVGRFADAVKPLEYCLASDPTWAAALVSLADAYTGSGQTEKARALLLEARKTALAQSHQSMAADIDDRLAELDRE